MAIGENIRRLRKEKGYTQKQLAEKCDMYESQIRKYELSNANPKLDTIRKISAALGVYISDLVDDWSKISKDEISEDLENDGAENMSHNTAIELSGYPLADSEKPLLETYRQLNPAGQDKAIEQVKLLTKIPEYRKEE